MGTSNLPDFQAGIDIRSFAHSAIVLGSVGPDEAMMVKQGDIYFAVGARCTHYHGALGSGLLVGDTVRCPLHHACFSLRTGAALRAPALDPISFGGHGARRVDAAARS